MLFRSQDSRYVPHQAHAAVRPFPSPALARSSRPSRSVFSTLYTLDSRFVLSGSDDSNLRIWKARAAEKLGTVDKREMARKEYRDGLREKWGSVAEVAKLERCVFLCHFSPLQH